MSSTEYLADRALRLLTERPGVPVSLTELTGFLQITPAPDKDSDARNIVSVLVSTRMRQSISAPAPEGSFASGWADVQRLSQGVWVYAPEGVPVQSTSDDEPMVPLSSVWTEIGRNGNAVLLRDPHQRVWLAREMTVD